MRLRLKNIGKVKEADILLDGLTVIADANGTGKSTIGKALFAICNAFYNLNNSIHVERRNNIAEVLGGNFLLPFGTSWDLFEKEAEKILRAKDNAEILKILKGLAETTKRNDALIKQAPQLFKFNEARYKEILKQIQPAIKLNDYDIITAIAERSIRAEFGDQARFAFSDEKGKIILTQDTNSEVEIKIAGTRKYAVENKNISGIFAGINKAVYIDNAIILDKENPFNSLLTFQKPLINHHQALDNALKLSPENNNLINSINAQDKLSNIWEKICEISDDSLYFEDDNWLYSLNNTSKDKHIDLELINLSTGILSFAIIKRLIENGSLRENSVLILDEPETHLHPAWQLAFAEIIVMLYKDFNLKILINTHSHYFLNAISEYSRKHEIQPKFYLSENKGDMAIINDVTKSLEKIYKKFWEPLKVLQDEENAR